jgi:hypothetical protein
MTYCNHLGSVAIGSFLVALVRFIKWTLVALAQYMEQMSGDNGCVKCVISCATCVISCFELITEYITEQAFCYIAVTGDNFFHGAYCAFILNIKHLVEFWWTHVLAKFFMFLGKISVIAGNVALYHFVLTPFIVGQKREKIGPSVFVVALSSYIMVSIFIGMYDVAADAMMTSYAIDVDFNDGEHQFGCATFWDGSLEEKRNNNQKIGQTYKGGNAMV